MSRNAEANGVTGYALTPGEVVADLRRILRDIDRVRRRCGDPATRMGLGRNADTLTHAIQLIEGTHHV